MELTALLIAGPAVQAAAADHASLGCLHGGITGGGSPCSLCAALQQAHAAARGCEEVL